MRTKFYGALIITISICESQNRMAVALKFEAAQNMFAEQDAFALTETESNNEFNVFTKA